MTEQLPTNDLAVLEKWIGRSQQFTDVILVDQCRKLAHTLGQPELAEGDVLPALWHFATHVSSTPLSDIGLDGHPKRGGFLPPVALPRRMWAGSRVEFNDDIRIGDTVTKTSTVEKVTAKTGRSGELCFVTLRHELAVGGEVRITEEQDLAYRDEPLPGAPQRAPKAAPPTAEFSEEITPSEVLLFRYSALTFNAHRIHYDRDYAHTVEGYDGLVVHGPLTATFLASLAARHTGERLASFSFRGIAPLIAPAPFVVAGNRVDAGVELWAQSAAGGLAMEASATMRS